MSPFLNVSPNPPPEKSTVDRVMGRGLTGKVCASLDGLPDFQHFGSKAKSKPKALHKPPGG
jgi:hypothetical protein